MSSKTQKKRQSWKVWLVISVLLAVVLVVGGMFLSLRNARLKAGTQYTTVKPVLGDISVTVYGSGSIEAGQDDSIYAPATGLASQVLVSVGDRVKQGDILAVLTSDSLDAQITDLENTLSSLDRQIAQLPSTAGSAKITAPVAGRIKAIYGAAGDPVVSVMDQFDALCIISANGKMKIELTGNNTLSPGESVTIEAAGDTETGLVLSKSASTTVVEVSDAVFELGSIAVVRGNDDQEVGQGMLQIEAPVYVTGSAGIIKSARYEVGDKVSKGAAIFTLNETGYSSTYLSLIDQRTQALSNLRTLREKKNALTLLAPAAGIVKTLNLTENGQIMENQPACIIGETGSFRMRVLIDELDIAQVKVGQTAELQLSALTYQSYKATVEGISAVGQTTGGVTTYPVTLRIDPADGILLNMSANANILVASKASVLTIPLKALKVDGARTYVTIIRNNGTRNVSTIDQDVTVGLANGSLVEITSGISASDEIQLIESTAAPLNPFRPNQSRPNQTSGIGG
jgi:HlyD family secretion protein